jgi:hypothetical protein
MNKELFFKRMCVILCLCFYNSSSLYADKSLTNAFMIAIAKENFALAVALYAEISKNETDKAELSPFIRQAFQRKFKQTIDDATQASLQFNQELASAGNDQKRLRELFIELMTNPQQSGGKVADKLGINKAMLTTVISS